MLLDDIMQQLAKNGLAIFSTADQDGNPHARPIHILSLIHISEPTRLL